MSISRSTCSRSGWQCLPPTQARADVYAHLEHEIVATNTHCKVRIMAATEEISALLRSEALAWWDSPFALRRGMQENYS